MAEIANINGDSLMLSRPFFMRSALLIALALSAVMSVAREHRAAAEVIQAIKITDPVPPAPGTVGEVFFDRSFPVDYAGGMVVLASNDDGTGLVSVDDGIVVTVTHPDATTAIFQFDYSHGSCFGLDSEPPHDITGMFQTGTNQVRMQFVDLCGGGQGSSAYWLVIGDAVTPDGVSGAWMWTDTTSEGATYTGLAGIHPYFAADSFSFGYYNGGDGDWGSPVALSPGALRPIPRLAGSEITFEGWTNDRSLSATWTGVVSPGGTAITGTWAQSDGQNGTFTANKVTPAVQVISDGSWRFSRSPELGWETTEFDDSAWAASVADSAGACGSVPGAMWAPSPVGGETVFFRRSLSLPSVPEMATLSVGFDDDGEVYLNGAPIHVDDDGFASGQRSFDVADYLVAGTNVIAIRASDDFGGCQSVGINLVAVDAPVLDSDGDGVADGEDDCPSQPETFDGTEDTDGCPDLMKLVDDFSPELIIMGEVSGSTALSCTNDRSQREDPYEPESVDILEGVSRLLDGSGAPILPYPLQSIAVLGDYDSNSDVDDALDIVGLEASDNLEPTDKVACAGYSALYKSLRDGSSNVAYVTGGTAGSSSSDFTVVITYNFFYFFDDWVNRHEGDWENIAVEFKSTTACSFDSVGELVRRDCGPQNVWYSQHGHYEVRGWADSAVRKRDDTHPVSFVGTGSHANYFKPGKTHALGLSDWAPRDADNAFEGDKSAQKAATGRRVSKMNGNLELDVIACPGDPGWLGYVGRWGEIVDSKKLDQWSGPRKDLCAGASA